MADLFTTRDYDWFPERSQVICIRKIDRSQIVLKNCPLIKRYCTKENRMLSSLSLYFRVWPTISVAFLNSERKKANTCWYTLTSQQVLDDCKHFIN